GSGIKGAVVNTRTGQLIGERYRIPTPKPADPEAVCAAIQLVISHFSWKGAVGCGFPTPLKQGKCLTEGNLHKSWKGVAVDALFTHRIGNKFTVINDADAAGIAESCFGAGKGQKGVVLIVTIGTGIGSSIFLDGKLLPNTELGHLLNKNGEIFENYASDGTRKRKDLPKKEWGKRLNKYFAHLQLILDPELIIVGGGASKKFDKLSEHFRIDTPIVAAKTQNEAGIIGAAMAASFSLACP
ncbi:MAG: ROK family protein, partial [Lutibacter sp.]|nr:ROK family protein [Lutibacter sp.]